jgi:hypothetical protein
MLYHKGYADGIYMVNQLPKAVCGTTDATRPHHGPPVSRRSTGRSSPLFVGAKHAVTLTISVRVALILAHGRYVTVTLESLNMASSIFAGTFHG